MYGGGGIPTTMTATDLVDCSALLRHYSADDLKELLNDEDKLNALVAVQLRATVAEKEMLLSSNKSLAEFNLSREPRLNTLRRHLEQTYEQAIGVFSETETKKKELDDVLKNNSLDSTLAILQTATAQSEEESENIAETFLSGRLDVEAFLEEFLTKRKVAHLRRIKVDKMMELLETGRRAVITPSSLYGNHQASMRMPQSSHYEYAHGM